jgi:pSer/pThr/pTyr-binding forkhead associated (FHA) protein
MQEYVISEDTTTIGRIGSNDIHILDEMVSGHHAKIICFQNNYFIEDLISTNGTFVNGKRIKKCVLKDRDQLAFGPYKMLFQVDSSTMPHEVSYSNETKIDNVVSLEDTVIPNPVAANDK